MPEDRSLRLLVVEDEGMLVMMLCDMLEELGHHVIQMASSVSDALRFLETRHAEIDACILDANLGGEIATPVARALQSARVPFIVVSGYETSELRRLELNAPTVAKPYRLADIGAALQKL